MKLRGFIGETALLLGALLLSLLCAEQLYRVYLFGWDSFSFERVNSVRPLVLDDMVKVSDHPGLGYELRPNLDQYFKLVRFQTNSQGLRDREYNLEPSPETFRIAVVGDSFVMASGLEIEKSFHSVLEDRLNSEGRADVFEVLNFGVGGYTLEDYATVVKSKVAAYRPDLILVGFCYNNDGSSDKKRGIHRVIQPFYTSFLSAQLERLMKGFGQTPAVSNVINDSEVRWVSEQFNNLGAYGEKSEVPIVIMLLSLLSDRGDVETLKNLAVESGLRFVDLSIELKEPGDMEMVGNRDYWISPMDGHPNDKANRIFSDRLYTYLRGKRLLPSAQAQSAEAS